MLTDKQLLNRLKAQTSEALHLMERKGLTLNPISLHDSDSDDKEDFKINLSPNSFERQLQDIHNQYEHRKEYTHQAYKEKVEKLCKKFRRTMPLNI